MFGAFMSACQRVFLNTRGRIPNNQILTVPLTGTGEDFRYDNDFTATGAEWSSDTLKGSCLAQNQTGDYLDGVSTFDISSTWTISLCVKKTNSNMVNQNILSIGDDTTEYVMVSMGDGSSNNVKLEVKGNSATVLNTLEPIVPNRWYHILVTGNNGEVTLFLDGSQVYQQSTTFTANTPNITIGNHVSTRTNGMVGRYSTLRAWNSVLSQSDVKHIFDYDLYNHPLRVDNDLIAVYPFYDSYDDNWHTQRHLTVTGSVPLTDRAANFNGNSGNFLKLSLSVPDIYAIVFDITPTNEITSASLKQQLIGFGASDIGVFLGQSDGSATNETLSIKSADGEVTYITDNIANTYCSRIICNWNSANSKYDIHVNGELVTQSAGTTDASLITSGDRISFSESDAYDGKISYVRIYSASLGAKDIPLLFVSSPDAYYTFINTLVDKQGNYSNASLINGASAYTDGTRGDVYYTDGTDDRIDLPLGNMGDIFTVTAWIKPLETVSGDDNILMNKAYTSHSSPYYEWAVINDVTNSKARINIYGDTTVVLYFDNNNYFPIDTWVHIAFSIDYTNSIARVYVNGQIIKSATLNNMSKNYNTPLSLGGYTNVTNSAYNTKCLFSDVRYYKEELDTVTVQDIYENTL